MNQIIKPQGDFVELRRTILFIFSFFIFFQSYHSFSSLTPIDIKATKKRCSRCSPLILKIESPGISSETQTDRSASSDGFNRETQLITPDPIEIAKQQNTEFKELLNEIESLSVNPESAYELGQKLLEYKKRNHNNNILHTFLIETLHNRASAPLRQYFTTNGKFEKKEYNQYLEECLPRACDNQQETPLIRPETQQHKLSISKTSAFEE